MDITSLSGVTSDYISQVAEKNKLVNTSDKSFSATLNSAMDMLNETNDLQNSAESAEIQFALGYSENTHDLQIAQYKASTTIQYITAIKNKAIEAYKEIMNMSI